MYFDAPNHHLSEIMRGNVWKLIRKTKRDKIFKLKRDMGKEGLYASKRDNILMISFEKKVTLCPRKWKVVEKLVEWQGEIAE